jgi:RNA polymerase sigma-70 factor (ECF subfamily)
MAVKPDDARVAHAGDGAAAGPAGVRPSPREDARLVDALRAGEPGAFAELVADYQAAVFNLALRLVRDREDARDITQDVLIKAHDSIPRTHGELRLWAWLYRVTVNACWDHLRAAGRRAQPTADAEGLAASRPGDDAERAELAGLFSQSLAALPPRQQAALLLKDVHGLDHADIAHALGISKGSSKVLLFHARHSFRRAYRALVADDPPAAVCRLAEDAVAASVGGRLSAAQRRAILRHAHDCAHCAKVVAGWREPRAVGLALALPLVAAPHLAAAPGAVPGALAPALAGAGASAGIGASATAGAGASAGTAAAAVTAVEGMAGAGAASAGSAATLGAVSATGATLGTAGGVAAKLAGFGVAKAAAVVLAAGSVAAYGGVEAYPTGATQPPPRPRAVSAAPAHPGPARTAAGAPRASGESASAAAVSSDGDVRERLRSELVTGILRPHDDRTRTSLAPRAWLRHLVTTAHPWPAEKPRAWGLASLARARVREARRAGLGGKGLRRLSGGLVAPRAAETRGACDSAPAADQVPLRTTARVRESFLALSRTAGHAPGEKRACRRVAGVGAGARRRAPASPRPAPAVKTVTGARSPGATATPSVLTATHRSGTRAADAAVRGKRLAPAQVRVSGGQGTREQTATRISSWVPSHGRSAPRAPSNARSLVKRPAARTQAEPNGTRDS